ncbi:unannotated protein [freshwater metagenome]|uniref:Unannotated protein n=1 Tax=freshwater metagenome TaxID=449393 RepID=A0A6J6XXD6_9ZZZZ
MTRTGIGERSIAINRLTTSAKHVEARVFVPNLILEIKRNSSDCFSDPLETLEVDFDIVINVDIEISLDCIDQSLSTISAVFSLSKRSVDAFFATRWLNWNPQITRERHEINGLVLRIDSDDHDRVRTLTSFLRAWRIEKR